MFKYTVIYDHPADVDAFDRHYLGTHVALAEQLPGLRRVEVTRFADGADGSVPTYHLMAGLYFDDASALDAALSTDAGKALRQDAANLGGTPATRLLGQVDI